MDNGDWRFDVMSAIRLSFREEWLLEDLKNRILEIQKLHEEEINKRVK